MTLAEAEEYFKEKNIAHEISADTWMEDTLSAIMAVTDAFERGCTLRDMSDVTTQIDVYIAQLKKSQPSDKIKGAIEAFLISKKLIEGGQIP